MELIKLNTQSVFCVGDIHGDFEGVIGWIKRYNLNNSAIIFCGDVGFGFNRKEYYKQTISKINRECKKRNVYCLFGRGNHDDPSYFEGKLFKKGFVRTMRDYTVIEIYPLEDNDYVMPTVKTILWVGGATSIDRTYRLTELEKSAVNYMRWHSGITYDEALKKCPQLYWENEEPIYDEEKLKEINNSGIKIECVCTHTCPSFCEPSHKNGAALQSWLKVDDKLSEDLDRERKVMDNIYNFLKDNGHPLKSWFYGHYHYHNMSVIDDVKYLLLDMGHYGDFDMVEIV